MHSKGPWTAKLIFQDYFRIVDADGKSVGVLDEASKHNANLIAAAPLMLEALKAAEPYLWHNRLSSAEVCRQITAAIAAAGGAAKAEGRGE